MDDGIVEKTINTTAFESCKTITIKVIMMQLYTLLESFKNGGGMQNLLHSFIHQDDKNLLVAFVFLNIPVILQYDVQMVRKTHK